MNREIDPSKHYTWWRPCFLDGYYYIAAGDILNDVPKTLSGSELAALVEKGKDGPDCVIRWREIAD